MYYFDYNSKKSIYNVAKSGNKIVYLHEGINDNKIPYNFSYSEYAKIINKNIVGRKKQTIIRDLEKAYFKNIPVNNILDEDVKSTDEEEVKSSKAGRPKTDKSGLVEFLKKVKQESELL